MTFFNTFLSSNYLSIHFYLDAKAEIFAFLSVDWLLTGMARQVNPGVESRWRKLAESTVRCNIDPGNVFTFNKERDKVYTITYSKIK